MLSSTLLVIDQITSVYMYYVVLTEKKYVLVLWMIHPMGFLLIILKTKMYCHHYHVLKPLCILYFTFLLLLIVSKFSLLLYVVWFVC